MTKGRVALPFGVKVVMTTLQTSFVSPSTCRRQVELLGMTKGMAALPLGAMVVMTTPQTLFILSTLPHSTKRLRLRPTLWSMTVCRRVR